METINIENQSCGNLLNAIGTKNPALLEELKKDQQLMEEIDLIKMDILIKVDEPPLSIESLRKIYGITGEDIEKSNEYALWRAILLRYFNDNVYGFYESFENGELIYPDNNLFKRELSDVGITPIKNKKLPYIRQPPLKESWLGNRNIGITVNGGGLREGCETDNGWTPVSLTNRCKHYVQYGLYKTSVDWLFHCSLPMQTESDMNKIKEQLNNAEINDIVSLSACGFAGDNKLDRSNWYSSKRIPNTANCQYSESSIYSTTLVDKPCKSTGLYNSCTIEDNIWENRKDNNSRYNESIKYSHENGHNLFNHMNDLFTKTEINNDNKLINIQFIDRDPGSLNDWFYLLYYFLFSHYYNRKVVVHCWGGYGRTGFVLLFYLLLDDIITNGRESWWHTNIINLSITENTYSQLKNRIISYYRDKTIWGEGSDELFKKHAINEISSDDEYFSTCFNNISKILYLFLQFFEYHPSESLNTKLINLERRSGIIYDAEQEVEYVGLWLDDEKTNFDQVEAKLNIAKREVIENKKKVGKVGLSRKEASIGTIVRITKTKFNNKIGKIIALHNGKYRVNISDSNKVLVLEPDNFEVLNEQLTHNTEIKDNNDLQEAEINLKIAEVNMHSAMIKYKSAEKAYFVAIQKLQRLQELPDFEVVNIVEIELQYSDNIISGLEDFRNRQWKPRMRTVVSRLKYFIPDKPEENSPVMDIDSPVMDIDSPIMDIDSELLKPLLGSSNGGYLRPYNRIFKSGIKYEEIGNKTMKINRKNKTKRKNKIRSRNIRRQT